MRIDRPAFARHTRPTWRREARSRLPEVVPVNRKREEPPLDWRQALWAAASRLNETWILPTTRGHPAVADMAARLAMLVCAYGKLAEEVDRMEARPDAPPLSPLVPPLPSLPFPAAPAQQPDATDSERRD